MYKSRLSKVGLFKELRGALPKNAVATLDAGTMCLQLTDALNFHEPKSLFTPLDFGLVGFSYPAGLGIKLAAFFRTEMLFDVPPEAFDIQPKVTSSFIRMTPLPNKLIQASEMKKFFEVVDLSFMSRRKNINNNLKKMDLDWEKLGINNQLRPEDLDLASYIKILDEVIDK